MASTDLHNPQYYFNRELSWLKFNERVLEEAEDGTNPLLERLKFLAIFSTNLDEFIMIRYAGLKEQVDAGITRRTFDGRTPSEQLSMLQERLPPMLARHRHHLMHVVLPKLKRSGVEITSYEHFTQEDRQQVHAYFSQELFPILTPLAVDSGHPFPRLPNLSLSLLMHLQDLETGQEQDAIVQVPTVVPRFLQLGAHENRPYRFTMLEEIIRAEADHLFVGYAVVGMHAFRVTRDADIEIAEDEADDLLHAIEDEVRKRRWGDPVRLEVTTAMPQDWLIFLCDQMGLDAQEDVYVLEGFLNIGSFMQLLSIDLPHLKDDPFAPRLPSEYRLHEWHGQADTFAAIREQDIFIHHPFHAFDAVLQLIRQAARDPDVLAIKQTLYRVGKNSPIVRELTKAADNGKHVTALVELKARFDEENNIVWARQLERDGVHVVYGLVGLKTHCKTLLIVRREGKRIRRYVHLGTGNYNPSTSTIYTDMALLTCDDDLGADVAELFNRLTGFSKQATWRKLWVAPTTLRPQTLAAIDREAEHALAGHKGRIIAKMNSLVDPEVIRALYRASQAGVEIDLVIRGICCLRPEVPGVSETIRVRSIVGRFLEHSRIFYFHNGGLDDIYLGSADWMQRNLNMRIEAVFPVENIHIKRKVLQVLELCLRDNEKTRELSEDGFYYRVKRVQGQRRLSVQKRLMALSERRRAQVENGGK